MRAVERQAIAAIEVLATGKAIVQRRQHAHTVRQTACSSCVRDPRNRLSDHVLECETGDLGAAREVDDREIPDDPGPA